MDTYSDTSLIFPYRLKGKKLKVTNNPFDKRNDKYYRKIEDYLKNKNPNCLVDALKICDDAIPYGKPEYDNFLNDHCVDDHNWDSVKKVSDNVVVWETIEYWSSPFMLDQELIKKCNGYLDKVLPLFKIRSPITEYRDTKDGLGHKLERKGSSNYKLYAKYPRDFLKKFNELVTFINDNTKSRYRNIGKKDIDESVDSNYDKALAVCIKSCYGDDPKKEDIQKIIKDFFDLEITVDEIIKIELDKGVMATAACIFALRHSRICSYCQNKEKSQKKFGYKKFITLKKEIEEALSHNDLAYLTENQ